MQRVILVLLIAAGSLCGQMPKGIYAWWGRPEIRRDLNLTPQQERQIQAAVKQFRPHLIDVRADVEKAEIELQTQFNRDPVDAARANQAIGRLIEARSDLTRTLSELSLKLRMVLSEQQWQQLQQRRPRGGGESVPAPTEGSPQK
jgi:Spy/CpxP family protein refolding chaperone